MKPRENEYGKSLTHLNERERLNGLLNSHYGNGNGGVESASLYVTKSNATPTKNISKKTPSHVTRSSYYSNKDNVSTSLIYSTASSSYLGNSSAMAAHNRNGKDNDIIISRRGQHGSGHELGKTSGLHRNAKLFYVPSKNGSLTDHYPVKKTNWNQLICSKTLIESQTTKQNTWNDHINDPCEIVDSPFFEENKTQDNKALTDHPVVFANLESDIEFNKITRKIHLSNQELSGTSLHPSVTIDKPEIEPEIMDKNDKAPVSSLFCNLGHTTSDTKPLIWEVEEISVVPPPMQFIPIFTPPLGKTFQRMFSSEISPSQSTLKNKSSRQNVYKEKDQFGKTFIKSRRQKGRKDPNSTLLTGKILLRRGSTHTPRNRVKVDVNRLQWQKRNCFLNCFDIMIKYSTATLGRKLDTFGGDKHQYKYFPSATINRLVHGFDPIERKIELDDATGERNIIPSAMEHIRQTYAMQCNLGFIRKPSTKDYDKNEEEEEKIVGTFDGHDNLYVIVGLTNIFVMQFIMVIMIFFAKT